MKNIFIINPKAGKGKALEYKEIIEEYFISFKEEYEILITEYIGHATKFLKEYNFNELCRVISIGGDGTLNEVINGIIGKEVYLGIIPAGSGNDFIKSYFEEKSTRNILESILTEEYKSIDIGKVNEKYFINIASLGFDANVGFNSKYFKNNKFISGSLSYILGGVLTLIKFRNIKVKIDNKEIEKLFFVTVANGKYYGGGKLIAPKADLEDGLFDIYKVKSSGIYKTILFIKAFLFKEDFIKFKETIYYKSNSVKIESKNDIIINIDGEIEKGTDFAFEIIPNALKVLMKR